MSIFDIVHSSKPDQLLPFMLLYIGPDAFLPFVSALAAAGGVLLMFWQRFVGLIRKMWRLLTRKKV